MSASTRHPHASRVVLAESNREVFGTRNLAILCVLGLIAVYYYIFVHHALPVAGQVQAPHASRLSRAHAAADARAAQPAAPVKDGSPSRRVPGGLLLDHKVIADLLAAASEPNNVDSSDALPAD